MQAWSAFPRGSTWGLLATLFAGALFLAACPGSPDSRCGTDSDCADNQSCVDGVCQVTDDNECMIDSDCPGGLYCNTETYTCESPPGPDTTPNDADGGGQDTADDPDDTGLDTGGDGSDGASDAEGPTLVGSTPGDGANNVATGTDITLEFDEPVRDGSLHSDALSLLGPNGNAVEIFGSEGSVDHPEPNKVVISVDASLRPASPYRVVMKEFLQDENRNPLQNAPVDVTFSTDWNEPPEHVMAARKWAPWIYQGIGGTGGRSPYNDLPTSVNFDGDLDASNNQANARSSDGSTPGATVYYHVTESESHLYLYYILYYPAFQPEGGDTHHEHHFAGAVFVVDKSTDELVVVDGLKLRDTDPLWLSFTEKGAGTDNIGSYSSLIQVPSDKWKLEDGTHYPMYVKAGFHETCHWYSEGELDGVRKCLHSSEQFVADDGVVLQPGDTADTWEDRSTDDQLGRETMTYKLVPLVDHFWALRNRTGDSGLFGGRFTYEPNDVESGRPSGYIDAPNEDHQLPKALNSEDSDSLGVTPFRWQSFSNAEGDGQWMLDPAFVSSDRFNNTASSRSDFSQTYCYNLFFGIDRRSSNADPACAGPMGGDAGMNGDAGGADAGN